MSEGELKKRIEEVFRLMQLTSLTLAQGNHVINDILDETEQDFPKIDDIYDYNDASRRKAVDKLYEILEWFKKQFGEAEK